MAKKLFLAPVVFLFTISLGAQSPSPAPAGAAVPDILASTITAEHLRRHVMVLSSDGMEGRETGQPGLRRAMRYVENRLGSFGAQAFGNPNGERPFEYDYAYHRMSAGKAYLTVGQTHLTEDTDFVVPQDLNDYLDETEMHEVVFLGYGIDAPAYSDYTNRRVRGKSIVIFSGAPPRGELAAWGSDTLKLRAAKKHGVRTVFVVRDSLPAVRRSYRYWEEGRGPEPAKYYAPTVYITPGTAEKIMGRRWRKALRCRKRIDRRLKAGHFTVPAIVSLEINTKHLVLEGSNILILIEGTDPKLKDEYVFVTAHLDHLGRRGDLIYNGADDNAGGSAALLELARVFNHAREMGQGPRRNIVIMWVTGEEKGLLGSKYYTNHPNVPLEQIVAEVNMDMIGRHNKADTGKDYVYVIGSDRLSTDLDSIIRAANEAHVGLELDYRYNAKDDPNRFYYRSDHYSFARKGIPSVFFFKGTHDDYHQPTDTYEKLDYDRMVKVVRLIFHTIWDLANMPARPRLNVEETTTNHKK